MGARACFVPEDFIQALKRDIQGFSELTNAHQAKMAFYIWMAGNNRRKHKRYDEHMSVSYKELEKDFGRGVFNLINDKLNIFYVTGWSLSKKQTKGDIS